MGKQILTTDRLILREMDWDDFDALCRILRDRDVMYAYEHAFSEEEAHAWLAKRMQQYADWGFSLWAVTLRETGEMIGQCGLTWQDAGGEPLLEVGYLFQKAFWHRGYATEAAIACRDYAFDTLHAPLVCAIIRDNNAASQRVARRCGMTSVRTFVKHYYGIDMPHLVFTASHPKERQ